MPEHWVAPEPGTRIAPPPAGRGPRSTTHRTRVRLVAATLAGALVLIGILSALPLLPTGQSPVQPASTPPPLVTVSPSAQPGASTSATSGGNLADPVAFRAGPASGSLLVRSATWTDAGELAPEPGRRYLILDVAVECTGGQLPVDPLMLLVDGPGGPELPAFGPKLANPLGGRVLKTGETARGQVGYALAPGEVTLQLLDSDLRPVAEVRIPAP